ncbi:MAG TPA: glycosyltransferase family 1 protein [Anaerolineales bacterium]|nr:glycosyltransferase family 1 protein [Anaerolineae bacterium]HIQ02173.1 glycosyltransferase family 1 protein [Anaerolineales bacterium]
MRVALNAWFWDRSHTGSGQYTRRLVEHLAALEPGLDVTLVLPRGGFGSQVSRFQVGGTLKPGTPKLETHDLGKLYFEQVAFPRACRRLGVDVAHVPYWAPPLLPSVPAVVTVHDLIPLLLREYRGGPRVRAYTALVAAAAQRAALVLTDSEAARRDILACLDLPPERVWTVHLAAAPCFRPDPDPEDETVRVRHGLPLRYILYLGGFDVRKNVRTALAAYTWAGPVIGEDCPLVVAGRLPERDTPFTPDPRRQAQALGLEPGWVRFIGPVAEEEKPALYRGAVAFLFPSRYEGFGLPPLEAMACGTPVVGSDTTSIPEVVGDAGVLVDPDDAAGMAGAAIQLAEDPDFRAELSRRALAQAARFSWERTARETLAAYRRVAT